MTLPAKRRPGRPLEVSTEAIAAALEAHHGNIGRTAEALGMSGWGLRKRIRSEPELAEALARARAGVVDLAESAIVEAIKAGEGWATIFTLKTWGRSHGWSEREEAAAAPPEEPAAALPPAPGWFLPPGNREWIDALPPALRAKLEAELAAAAIEERAGRLDIFDDHELHLLLNTRLLGGLDRRDLDRILEFQPGQYRAEIEAARLPGDGPHPGGVPLDLARLSRRCFASLIGGLHNLYVERTGAMGLPHPLEPFHGIPPAAVTEES